MTEDEPGVTVAITYFDEDVETLSRAYASAFDQTIKAREIIIVDDGSATPEIPDHVATMFGDSKPPATQVVHITNRGLPSARNTALMLCRTVGWVPLDADDWLAKDYIEKTLPWLEDGADVVLTGLQEQGPYRRGTYNPGYDRHHSEVTWQLLMDDYNRFFYCALHRTSILRKVGGYHPALAGWPGVAGGFEDWDMWITLLRKGVRIEGVYEPLLNYNTATPGSMLARAEQNREVLKQEMRRHHKL